MNTLVKRLLIALGAGIVAFNLTAIVAWETGRSAMDAGARRGTEYHFRKVAYELDKYLEAQHKLPVTLAEVRELRNDERNDGWGNPMVYERQGKTYTLHSLGADGKPGGEGIDADKTNLDTAEKAQTATLKQFLTSPKLNAARQNFLTCCLAHGALWAFAVFGGTKENTKKPSPGRELLMGMGLIVGFAITLFGAILQFSLELIPSGH